MAETRYARLINGRPDFAGAVITLPDGRRVANPTEAHLRAAGYKPYIDEPPAVDAEHYAAPTGWEDRDGAIRRTYEVRELPPPPPRRWSRLSIKTALAQAGMLSQALAYLAQVEIATGYSAAEALTDCDYIEEGYPTTAQWGALLDGAANALGKTRAEIDSFLDTIPTE